MKKLILIVLTLVLVTTLGACTPQQDEPPTPMPSQWQWYTAEAPEPSSEYWEDPTSWHLGTLMPNTVPKIVDGDECFHVELRGELEGCVVFGLSHFGIFPKDWLPRIVELTSSEAIVTFPQWEDYANPALTGYGQFKAINDVRKLDNGNYLVGKSKVGVFEIERVTGEVIRFMADSGTAHSCELLPNDNILMNNPGQDMVYEKTWDGEIVWSWSAKKHIKPYNTNNYVYFERSSNYRNMYYEWRQASAWTQVNHVERLSNGHHLLSLKNLDIVAEIDEDGKIVWTYGALTMRKIHHPTRLENGNTLIHDTGNNRVIEVTPEHEIVWEFNEGMFSPKCGIAQRKDNGNTVILDGMRGCVFEVTYEKECVWEVQVVAKRDACLSEVPKTVSPGIMLFRAWWYLK